MKLEISDAAKDFGDKKALDGVSFVADGGIVGLLGMNGAGKSTLFRAILGLIRLDRGKIAMRRARRRTPQPRDPPPGRLPARGAGARRKLTGGETLELVAALKGVDPSGGSRPSCSSFSSWRRARHPGRQLFARHAQEAGADRRPARPPQLLLLLDEPLNALDAASMRRLRRHLETLAAEGSTIVFSSRYLAFAERLCARGSPSSTSAARSPKAARRSCARSPACARRRLRRRLPGARPAPGFSLCCILPETIREKHVAPLKKICFMVMPFGVKETGASPPAPSQDRFRRPVARRRCSRRSKASATARCGPTRKSAR